MQRSTAGHGSPFPQGNRLQCSQAHACRRTPGNSSSMGMAHHCAVAVSLCRCCGRQGQQQEQEGQGTPHGCRPAAVQGAHGGLL